ncbi:MAG: hypothetical protein IT437_06810 [Phycisphaerales bacterium]|nr:hypothetical protein [Phycisphaerales bacterium]
MSGPKRSTVIGGLAAVAAALACAGCRAPPISDTDERSPYDRYDYLRNQRAEGYTEDQYGKKIPNLRERLLPHE